MIKRQKKLFLSGKKTVVLYDISSGRFIHHHTKNLMMYVIFLCFMLLMTILVGCMMGKDYKQPVIFSNSQIEKALNLNPKKNLRFENQLVYFNDRILKNMIDKAIRNSPSIRSALVKVRQSRAGVSVGQAQLAPTVDLDSLYHYLNDSKNMEAFMQEDYYQSALDVSWEIDIFGANRRRLESLQANFYQSVENLKNVYISLISNVCFAYIDLRMAEQLLKNAEQNLELQQQILETVQEQFNAGLTNEITLNQAQYLVETTQMNLPKLKYNITQAQNILAILVGQLPSTLNKELSQSHDNLVDKPIMYNHSLLYGVSADVIRFRPDVKMAEAQLISNNALVGAAVADMFPKVSISALFGFGSVHFNRLFERDGYEYGYTPQISMPIFHFGALRQNVEIRRMIQEESLIAYENALLTAAQDVYNALYAIETEKQHNRFAVNAFQKMSDVSRLNWERYQQGLIEYADVLDSEQRRLSAQTDMVQSNATLYKNMIVYYKAIGGYNYQD